MSSLVPVVDISAWRSDEAARDAIARAVEEACATIGFLQISGHGIPPAVIEAMLEETEEFFGQPAEEKLRCLPPSRGVDRGYAPVGSEALTYSLGVDTPPDLFEAFNIGPDQWPADDPIRQAEADRFFAPNIWPERPTRLRHALVTYYNEAERVSHLLTEIFAVALGLPEPFFVDKTDHSTDVLRFNHYGRPAGSAAPLPGQQRMGAHTDYGVVTVLYADQVPGLQIVGPDGEWHDVIPADDCLLVNLGDLLAQWTNDRWKSTLHRVVPPPADVEGPYRRRSVAFFHDGNYDALVECLPTCSSTDNPARYAPVLAGAHLDAKLIGPRTLSRSVATSTADDRMTAVKQSTAG
jgi:isopenicillin N synthase-like dioxygenase